MSLNESSVQNYALHDPDVRLMLQVREGSGSAFEELVFRYQNRLVTVLEQLVQRREQAEDLAQEVFLRVYRARGSYKPDAKFCTWLFTIANNVAKNAKRSMARRREVSASTQSDSDRAVRLDQMAQAASTFMPARQAEKLERSAMVREAIQLLDERQRMALMLSKFEGLSYVEIAAAMGLSVEATKSLLFRAREKLRERLEPYMKDGVHPTATAGRSAEGGANEL
ncbi:MAG: sigma-70 family RNA polymerase sigma factor [Pirellulaceae bacterium]